MRLISRLQIAGYPGRAVELLQGDLTEADPAHPFDLLVVSAFPNDYLPTPTSLIGALLRKGVSVERLSKTKDVDLRENFSCWLSRDVTSPSHSFRRVLCFEPLVCSSPPEVTSDIFRALAPILGDHPEIRTVAMPIVATGDQRWPVAKVLPSLLEAAVHWMTIGLPLDVIKIVVHSNSHAADAGAIFAACQATLGRIESPQSNEANDFDVFLSYAHLDQEVATRFDALLTKHAPQIRVFLDRRSISVGTAWQPAIFESIDRCKKLVALLSPAYLQSKVCKEEFNIAWARSRETEVEMLFPIYLYSAHLPTYMTYRSYFDCREASSARLADACDALLKQL